MRESPRRLKYNNAEGGINIHIKSKRDRCRRRRRRNARARVVIIASLRRIIKPARKSWREDLDRAHARHGVH